jgi:hypothetical protein
MVGKADIEQEKSSSAITLSTSPDPCHRLYRLTDPDLLRNLVPHKDSPDREPVRQRFRHRHDIGPLIPYPTRRMGWGWVEREGWISKSIGGHDVGMTTRLDSLDGVSRPSPDWGRR